MSEMILPVFRLNAEKFPDCTSPVGQGRGDGRGRAVRHVQCMIALFFLWLLACSSVFAETKTVKMGVYSWEPYVSKDNGHGILSEIMIAALERAGYSVSTEAYPFARIVRYLESGDVDIAPAISRTDERSRFVDFSEPLYQLDMGFAFKKGKIHYATIADLKAHTGGVMRSTFWSSELDAAGVKYEEVTDQEQNIRKLIVGRIGFVCMPREIAFRMLKAAGEDSGKYEFALFKKEGQSAGISKKTRFKTLPGDFRRGLLLIKRDGTYDKILSKYKVPK